LAVTLLTSVSGFNLYLHHCSCEGIRYVTALAGPDCCDHREDQAACCQVSPNATSCCSNESTDCTEEHLNRPECCSTQLIYLKLNTDLDFQVKQNPIHPTSVAVADLSAEDPAATFLSTTFVKDYSSIPVRSYGKFLLITLHQLRADC
ncbi:MAG TPA: hypothetical protein PKH94_11410, partial [Bacteroidales bacterium]|nr:hypothetical protein [Bacteroidales bacterium]